MAVKKPSSTFTGIESDPSLGANGPAAIKTILDIHDKMFDPDATHDTGEPGGIQVGNIATDSIGNTGGVGDAGKIVQFTASGDLPGNVETATTAANLVSTADQDIGNVNFRAKTLQSDIPTGNPPLIVASTTEVTNLKSAKATLADNSTKLNNYTSAQILGAHGRALFTTPGTASFTVPAGVTEVWVTLAGGGGGARGASSTLWASGGGGAATVKKKRKISGLTPGDEITVTVGTAGVGGASAGNNGTNGGTSSFGAYISAAGGSGSTSVNGANLRGTNGTTNGASPAIGGNGGSTSLADCFADGGKGDDGIGTSNGVGGKGGEGYGAGGGGAASEQNNAKGGDGATGCVFVEW